MDEPILQLGSCQHDAASITTARWRRDTDISRLLIVLR